LAMLVVKRAWLMGQSLNGRAVTCFGEKAHVDESKQLLATLQAGRASNPDVIPSRD
jgi:hypothetical protein